MIYSECSNNLNKYKVKKKFKLKKLNNSSFVLLIFEISKFRNIGRSTRRGFLREILYKSIAIIAIQHNNMYFVDTSGDFSHTVG